MTANPLVAAPAEHSPEAWEGVWIAQDIEGIYHGAVQRDWLAVGLNGVGAALDTWQLATDPVGTRLRSLLKLLREAKPALKKAAEAAKGGGRAAKGTVKAMGSELKTTATAVRRSLRDHPLNVRKNLREDAEKMLSSAHSGVPVPQSLEKVPEWLRKRLMAGVKWHREQQHRLQNPHSASELHVHKPVKTERINKGTNFDLRWKESGPFSRLDHYDFGDRLIYSMKHTQLARIQFRTAKQYIDELISKYRPGTPIADVPSTPEGLRGGLEGRMILYVPKQEAAIPQKIIDYARRPGVLIVESR